ncbi:MAG: type II toxin-antitoxin system VapC family toxin [Nitrococcus sp.]|nr:type II toxin-antitoxin system VapC family toxin [Nitrococcus sp.]
MPGNGYLIDSNVLLDVLEEDPSWFDWSSQALAIAADHGTLVINPVIYAEVSIGFETIENLEALLPKTEFLRAPLPWEAAFLAGKCFVQYRRQGGLRRSPLPDFFIGAHAAVEGLMLVTRDASRYRTYFPSVRLVNP